jgi:hypothetical protein
VEILRVLLGELRPASGEELAACVVQGGGDERVAGPEVVDEHPRAGLESFRELPQGDLTALTSDKHLCRLGLEAVSIPLVARATRCCNVVTGIGG